VVFVSSFRSLLCTLSTCQLDPVASCESPCQTPWRPRTVHIACSSLDVSAFATILHVRTLDCSTQSAKSLVRIGQVYPCQICRRAASLKDPAMIVLAFSVASCSFTGALNSTMSATPFPICTSALCRTSPTFPTKLVSIVCVLTAICSPSCLLVAAPFLTGRLLSSSTLSYSACSSIAFLANPWARSRKESEQQRHSLKLGKKRRESSERNYYIISPRVIIKAIIISPRPTSNACRQRTATAGCRRVSLPVGYLAYYVQA